MRTKKPKIKDRGILCNSKNFFDNQGAISWTELRQLAQKVKQKYDQFQCIKIQSKPQIKFKVIKSVWNYFFDQNFN